MKPEHNKFHVGAPDGKHYWLTPPDLMTLLKERFGFDFDPCPYPKGEFDGLTADWGQSNYVNPPFGSIMHNGKKKGPTAWARKAIEENRKGKQVVMVYPIDKWVLMLLAAGAKVENLGDVRWHATEDGSQGKGTGRHIAMFILPATRPDGGDSLWEAKLHIAAYVENDRERTDTEVKLRELLRKSVKYVWDRAGEGQDMHSRPSDCPHKCLAAEIESALAAKDGE